MDNTRFIKNFYIMLTPGKGTKNDVTSPSQWDAFMVVLNASDLKFLSLNGVENPRCVELNGSSRSKKVIKVIKV